MRQGQQNRRGRGRNSNGSNGSNNNSSHGHSNNQNRRGQNPLSRNYESNGPGVKIRGNAAHVAEKYMSLARDAQSSSDSVMAENYLQHAEHYNRIIMAAQQPGDGSSPNAGMVQRPLPGEFGASDDDMDGDGEEQGQSIGGSMTAPVQVSGGQGGYSSQGQPLGYGQNQNRNGYNQRGEGNRGDGNRGDGNRHEGRHEGRPDNRHDGNRGDRFPRDRDGRDRDGRDRDRDGGPQRMPQRPDNRPDNRHENRHDQPRRDQPRSEHGRPDQNRPDQNRNDQGRNDAPRHEQTRHEQPRQNDIGRQPQPMVEHNPVTHGQVTGGGFVPVSPPVPSFGGEPSAGGFGYAQVAPAHAAVPAAADIDSGVNADAGRVERSPVEGDAAGFRRERPERAPRPGIGEEGYRAPRRRRAPVAASGAEGAESLEGEAAPAPRRKSEPDASSE
jgi:hypothetical protein